MSTALREVYKEVVMKYKGFDFLKIVEKEELGVLLKISPLWDKEDVIYTCLIVDESYLYDLAEMIEHELSMWIDENTSEIERIFAQLINQKGV
ncbi:DUF1108 family protein [Mammaliicoccus sciuri]|uniref:DUF1108 family protein n=1 Tax=Mammaliicoccus sciuri TaxID=1296 RepID=UPI000CD12617|nr:DUF1108 family protein [Mammaliicoccus sciuri]PNZ30026.1 hypothetical protein CD114_01350 [Mammaliicoccus sciuri]